MGRKMSQLVSFSVVMLLNIAAWAGSSGGGAGPAGDQGSSGAEPEMIALILFSLLPGIYFARKAMLAQQPVRIQDR